MQFNVGIGDNPNHRQDAYTTFLKPVTNQPNIKVITDAHVSKILFKQDGSEVPVVSGVEYYHNGEKYTIDVNREVIVSAGSIGNPQLLQLS